MSHATGTAMDRILDPLSAFAGPLWARLSIATAVSVALHSAALFAWNPPRAGTPASGFVPAITVRLASAAPVQGAIAASLNERPSAPGAPASRSLLPPRYYLATELDRRPKPIEAIEPDYPADANAQKGTLALRVMINERGTVDDVAVLRAEPRNVFESSAIAAFSGARFSPGMLDGVAVKSQLAIEIEYLPPKGTPRDPLARSGAGY